MPVRPPAYKAGLQVGLMSALPCVGRLCEAASAASNGMRREERAPAYSNGLPQPERYGREKKQDSLHPFGRSGGLIVRALVHLVTISKSQSE